MFKRTLIVAALGLAASLNAQAAPGYCILPAQLQTDGLALLDASFMIGSTNYSPKDCYGIVNTGSSDVASNLTFINDLRWVDFLGGVKDDINGGVNAATIGGIAYTLTTGANTGNGTATFQSWTLSWADANATGVLPDLPATVDLAIQWNGGNKDVFYLFEDVLLPIDPSNGLGSIEIKVMNKPGNSDLGTSHLTAYFTAPVTTSTSSSGPSTGQAPEPASSMLALLGVGLLGASMWGRRRWNRS